MAGLSIVTILKISPSPVWSEIFTQYKPISSFTTDKNPQGFLVWWFYIFSFEFKISRVWIIIVGDNCVHKDRRYDKMARKKLSILSKRSFYA